MGRKKHRELGCEITGPAGFERLLAAPKKYHLRLYVAGTNLNSFHAIEIVRRLCDETIPGRVDLEVIDLYQQPELAKRDHIIAAPALIKVSPPPRRMFIGDMSDEQRLLTGLGIRKSQRATVHGR